MCSVRLVQARPFACVRITELDWSVMKRRDFSLLATAAGAAGSTLWSASALADAAKPEAGADYVLVDPRAPVDSIRDAQFTASVRE